MSINLAHMTPEQKDALKRSIQRQMERDKDMECFIKCLSMPFVVAYWIFSHPWGQWTRDYCRWLFTFPEKDKDRLNLK